MKIDINPFTLGMFTMIALIVYIAGFIHVLRHGTYMCPTWGEWFQHWNRYMSFKEKVWIIGCALMWPVFLKLVNADLAANKAHKRRVAEGDR